MKSAVDVAIVNVAVAIDDLFDGSFKVPVPVRAPPVDVTCVHCPRNGNRKRQANQESNKSILECFPVHAVFFPQNQSNQQHVNAQVLRCTFRCKSSVSVG